MWGIRLSFGVYRLCGPIVLQLFLYPIVTYYWLAKRSARQASRDYLNKIAALAPHSGIKGDAWNSYRHFLSFANAIIDKLAAWSGSLALDDVVYRGRTSLQKDLQPGRGALLLASHLGNLEVCRAIAVLDPALKINVLVHTKHARKFNRLLSFYNAKSALNLMQVTEINAATAMLLAEKIEHGELVIIAADRTPVTNSRRVVQVDFLGAPALFPQGGFILAALLKCPVYLLFCLKEEQGYTIVFEHFGSALRFPRAERERLIQEAAQRYATRLQGYCLSHPLQWYNFYDFWGG